MYSRNCQRNITGEGREERDEIVTKHDKVEGKVIDKKKLSREDEEIKHRLYELICKDISSERKRIGGNWAIAGCLLRKKDRDICR